MRISYQRLFNLMALKGVKTSDLRKNGFSPTVVNRLVKDGFVNTLTILKLYEYLNCQPGDIMECIDTEV